MASVRRIITMSARTDFIAKLSNINTHPKGYEYDDFIANIENYVSGLNFLKDKIMEWMSGVPVAVSVTDCQAVAENQLYKSPYRAVVITLMLKQNYIIFEPGPLFFHGQEFSVITVKKSVSGRHPVNTFAQLYMARRISCAPPSLYVDTKMTVELNEEYFFNLIDDLTQ